MSCGSTRDKVRAYGLTVAQVYQQIAADLTTTTTAKTPVVVDGTSMTVQITDNLDPVTKENMMGISFETTPCPPWHHHHGHLSAQ